LDFGPSLEVGGWMLEFPAGNREYCSSNLPRSERQPFPSVH
jgi:hypothetical protein